MATILDRNPERIIHITNGHFPSDVHYHRNMPLTMNLRFLSVPSLLACCALAGCHKSQPRVTREVLAGSYTYVSKDPESLATDHNLNHLVLQSDGRYDLIEGGTTKAVSEKKGIWRIEPGRPLQVLPAPARPGAPSRWIVPGSPPNVQLDHAGYPIEIKRNELRLLVDLDVGIWWVKRDD
jgi:hypothetical protein